MISDIPSVTGMTWWTYVRKHSGDVPASHVASAIGVTPSSVGRWGKGSNPDPAQAAAFARAYGRPVLEAFIAAGFLTPDEAGERPAAATNLAVLDDEALLGEVARRMRRGGTDAQGAGAGEKSPGGGGAAVRRLTPKQQRFQEQALDQMDAADHPDRDRGPDGGRR